MASNRIPYIIPLVFLLLAGPARAQDEEATVVVPAITPNGVEETTADILTDLLLEALLNRHGIRALGPSVLNDMLSVEQQKMLLGCDDDGCMAEIAGSLGARYLIAGSVGRIGTVHVLSLRLIDTHEAKASGLASLKLTKVEDAIDAIGPLTDKLLGKKARVVTAESIAAFETTPAQPDYEPLPVRDFCKQVDKYRERLEQPPYEDAFVKTRETLLRDLILTPFKRQFDEKRGCLINGAGWVTGRLRVQLLSSDTVKDALDARQRRAEWITMHRNLDLVNDEYAMGLEKVKLGTGTLPRELPFAIEPAVPSAPEETPDVQRYKKSFQAAQKTVARAIKLYQGGTLEQFETLWTPKDPEKSRTSENYIFDRYQSALKNGYTLSPCPFFVIETDDVEYRAKTFADKKELVGCLRKVKDDYATTDTVRLRLHEGAWKIDRW